jgi:hypothetical protein
MKSDVIGIAKCQVRSHARLRRTSASPDQRPEETSTLNENLEAQRNEPVRSQTAATIIGETVTIPVTPAAPLLVG